MAMHRPEDDLFFKIGPAPKEEPKAYIITTEAEARVEFGRLTDYGFEVRRLGQRLDLPGFIQALEQGLEIQIRHGRTAGDTVDYDAIEIMSTLGLLDPAGTYQLLTAEEYFPFVPGQILTGDDFVQVAADKGSVDLTRTATNPDTGEPFLDEAKRPIIRRYYGTQIGKSGDAVPSFTKKPQGRVM